MFSYSYEKIREELSTDDRFLARIVAEDKEIKRRKVLELMGKKLLTIRFIVTGC